MNPLLKQYGRILNWRPLLKQYRRILNWCPLLEQYGRILNLCHAFGFAPFKWSHKKQEVTILANAEKKWSKLVSVTLLLLPLSQTVFMTFQSVRALMGLSGSIPAVRKMQMVYYAMGYIAFNVNFLPVFQRGGSATATVMNNLKRIEKQETAGKSIFRICIKISVLKPRNN